MKNKLQTKIKSPFGDIYLVATSKGLHSLHLKEKKDIELIQNSNEATSPEGILLKQSAKELQEYFAGKRKNFEMPLDLQGTEFQVKVWNLLVKIPYGKTTSYKQIADKIGTKAFRAVGRANGKNPIWIIVPCHRVIATGGGLGGYAGGLKMKETLLNLEFADSKSWSI